MEWFYAHHNEQKGPVTEEEFRELVARGIVTPETLVWNETLTQWQPFAGVARAAGDPARPAYAPYPSGQVQCAQCKNHFPEEDTIAYKDVHVCARCKPFFFQSLREGGHVPGEMRYAGFWIRFGAKILDGLIMSIPMYAVFGLGAYILYQMGSFEDDSPLPIIAQVAWYPFAFGVQIVYGGYFLSKYGATPGKMICGLKVLRADGSALTTGRGYGRALGDLVTNMTCLIGYIIAAFDDQKRALHDYMCDTRVVYK